MRKAMYAFSGDPIQYGHIDIIQRAAKIFDKVVVGFGVNANKADKYMFTLDERMEMARRSLSNIPNVELVSFKGLTVDYAYENGIDVIVKGVRNAADSDYEKVLHEIGETQNSSVDTFVLFARPELAHISSTAVKDIQREQGLIHGYVPLYVKQCLEAKISGQYIVGITGEIGVGKSYISRKIVEIANSKGIQAHNIELDYVGHKILGELTEPKYDEVRTQIAETFGQHVRKLDGTIDRKALGDIVFNDVVALQKLNEIMEKPLMMRLRRELYDKKGLILFNAALIAESDMSYLCNNNVILIYADKQTQNMRIGKRGLTQEQIDRRLASQFNFEEKRQRIQESIDSTGNGKIWAMDNSEGKDEAGKILEQVLAETRLEEDSKSNAQLRLNTDKV